MSRLKQFGAFWYDFIVGDDWRRALAAVAALGVTALAVEASLAGWWVAPIVVAGFLTLVVLRA